MLLCIFSFHIIHVTTEHAVFLNWTFHEVWATFIKKKKQCTAFIEIKLLSFLLLFKKYVLCIVFLLFAFSSPLQVVILDPSQIHRPEENYKEYNDFIVSRTDKSDNDFRNFNVNLQTDVVYNTYALMHKNQTLDFVKRKVCFEITRIYLFSHSTYMC